jgi:threonine synthase
MNTMMSFSCSACGKEYPVETRDFRCICGGTFRLNHALEPLPIASLEERERSIWRYREALPIVDDRNIVSMGEGFTPLLPFAYGGFKRILVKLDYVCPTGSFKDRGSSVLVSKLKELAVTSCVVDSSGNAGASIAAYTARAGIECRIYCPANTSKGKLVQIGAYGAQLVKIPGTRAETGVAVQEEAKRRYYASPNWNPFFVEGVKTLTFEICEQLTWEVPDVILCPTGYAGIQIGLYHGFQELIEMGIINATPRIFGIQSEAISPIYQAFCRKASEIEEVPPRATLAEGIGCVRPIKQKEILEIAQATNGGFEIVSEEEIIEGWKKLSRQGIYVEPTSAVVVRAIDRLERKGLLSHHEKIVLILTGSGLKATEKMGKYLT